VATEPPSPAGTAVASGSAGGRAQTLVQLALTCGAIYVCYRLAAPFFSSITWALVLAILFAPVHRRIEARLKSPTGGATVSLLIVALIVVAPASLVMGRLVGEAAKGAILVQEQVEAGAWRHLAEAHPWLASLNHWIEQQIDLPALFRMIASWLTNATTALVKSSAQQLLTVLLTFYLLFFFLRDRGAGFAALESLSPFAAQETARLLRRIVDTVYATIFGMVAVAVVQGALAGLMFWWLDLPTPLLWGLIMALLAIVPVLGTFVVWVPAAIYLALQGDWARAAILAAWGGLIVANIDNVLRPALMGDRLKLHTAPMFISILGGLALFGPSGVVLGPVAITTTLALLETWRNRRDAAPPPAEGEAAAATKPPAAPVSPPS